MPAALLLALTAAALATESARPALSSEAFRTPSRNIGCYFHPRSDFGPPELRCDILSGLKPEPRRACAGDWTGLTLGLGTRGGPACAGDTVYDRSAPILGYGKTWKRSGFVCLSMRTGLRCRNSAGHGFLLARERWRVF